MSTRRLSPGQAAFWLLALALALIVLAGCQRVSRQMTANAGLQIDLIAPLFAPLSGPGTLHVAVRDEAGNPVQDAAVRVRGDMSHAGMLPVLSEAARFRDGVYDVPFEWTMGGDWILTVDATLPDGRAATDRFDVSVTTDGGQYRCTVTRASGTEN